MTVPSSKLRHWLASNPIGSNLSTVCYSRIEKVGGRGQALPMHQTMDRTDPGKRLGKEVQDDDTFFCPTCASRPCLMISILDSHKGRTVRIFECRCGEIVWDD